MLSILYFLLLTNRYYLNIALHFNMLHFIKQSTCISSKQAGQSGDLLQPHPHAYHTLSRLVSSCLDGIPRGSQLFQDTFCVSALLIKPKHMHGAQRTNQNSRKTSPFFSSFPRFVSKASGLENPCGIDSFSNELPK